MSNPHPIFQNKNTQTKQPTPLLQGGLSKNADTPFAKMRIPPSQSTNDREKYAKKKVQEAFRKALLVWHKNPKFQGKDFQVCKKVVSEMFPNLPVEEF
ncbi:hypothetical protein KKF55_04140 [Patescibacteria group bacterium]|nr:hypothetical protein [Patescibacteria group bacterium]